MPTTTRLGLPYPAETATNDVPRDILALAIPLDAAAIDNQGTLASRPAAGTSGKYYWATDQQCLYRDNGTSWNQLTPSSWQTWVPTIGPVDGSGANAGSFFTLTVTNLLARYRTLPGGQIDLSLDATVTVNGTNPGWGGINMINLPASGTSRTHPLECHFQNELNRCWVNGSFMSTYSIFTRQWNYSAATSELSIRGTYSTN